jgi:ubiquitin C-terminal hydrolase
VGEDAMLGRAREILTNGRNNRVSGEEVHRESKEVFYGLEENRSEKAVIPQSLNPANLLRPISERNPLFGNHQQHEAHEFFLEYADQLHDSLLDRGGELPTTLFDSDIEVSISCKSRNE